MIDGESRNTKINEQTSHNKIATNLFARCINGDYFLFIATLEEVDCFQFLFHTNFFLVGHVLERCAVFA